MAKLTANQESYVLIGKYESLYAKKYGQKPTLNRNKIKWAFQDMVKDLTMAGANEVIEFYFTTGRVGHPVEYLLYNYDKLSRIKSELDADDVERARIRMATRIKVEEWARTHGDK